MADDPQRRRAAAVGGYTTTAVLSGLIGVAASAWQVGLVRAGAWAARGLRVPSRNALLADVVPATAYRNPRRGAAGVYAGRRRWGAHACRAGRGLGRSAGMTITSER